MKKINFQSLYAKYNNNKNKKNLVQKLYLFKDLYNLEKQMQLNN